MSTGKDFLQSAIRRMKYYKDLGDRSFEQLQEVDFYYQPNAASNSIAIIIQHLYGNMKSRWTDFLTTDGEKEWRERDGEFEVRSLSREELMEMWEKGWACFIDALDSLRKKDLKKTVYIRQEPLTVTDAIIRQLAHYPYHVGQIVYISRIIKNESWKNLSIPKGASVAYNSGEGARDPAKKF